MELYQLRTFLTVADEGHLTRAAERLCTSQPAVSAHVKALEEQLGIALFNRTPRGMKLTREGERLRPQAEQALASVSDLVFQARALKGELSGEVRLALHSDPGFLRLPDIHARVTSEYPELELHFLQGMSAGILSDVKHGILDGGFFFGNNPYPEVAGIQLREVRLRVVGPASWAERMKDAGWSEIAGLPWVFTTSSCPFRGVMEEMFEAHGVRPVGTAASDDESTLRSLVSAGVGLTLMREDEAERGTRNGAYAVWQEAAGAIPLCFAYQRRRANDPVIKALAGIVCGVWDVALRGEWNHHHETNIGETVAHE